MHGQSQCGRHSSGSCRERFVGYNSWTTMDTSVGRQWVGLHTDKEDLDSKGRQWGCHHLSQGSLELCQLTKGRTLVGVHRVSNLQWAGHSLGASMVPLRRSCARSCGVELRVGFSFCGMWGVRLTHNCVCCGSICCGYNFRCSARASDFT